LAAEMGSSEPFGINANKFGISAAPAGPDYRGDDEMRDHGGRTGGAAVGDGTGGMVDERRR
jgi:hypothetical protein